jgi:hypothetical protein
MAVEGAAGDSSSIRPSFRAPLVITGIFFVSRIAFFAAGVRFDMGAITGPESYWQVLDLHQLQHNLVQSIWYLQSQPPLFNTFTGMILHLPAGMRGPVLVISSLALGLALALSCYYLCLELRLPHWLSLLLTVLVVLDPATVLYENWYFYSFPTAVVITFCALCVARYVRTKSSMWGLRFFGSLMTIVLLNSTFQWIWLVVATAVVFVVFTHRWKSVLIVASVPIALVSVWYVKNAVIFQTYTTSSWIGMNLANVTLVHANPGQFAKLLSEKKLSPLAVEGPFAELSAYGHALTAHGATGVVVLDQRTKSDGSVNFNNINYINISNLYLHDDLVYIKAYPASYVHEVVSATELFFQPQEQYVYLGPNANRISGYLVPYNLFVDLQAHTSNFAPPAGKVRHLSWEQMSMSAVLIYALATLVAPFAIWRQRRDLPFAITLAFIWMSTVYVFVITSLGEFGENMRFRYDLGPLPMVAAAAVVVALCTRTRETASIDNQRP